MIKVLIFTEDAYRKDYWKHLYLTLLFLCKNFEYWAVNDQFGTNFFYLKLEHLVKF